MRTPKLSLRKTPRQSRSRETVEAILTAAADILARKGYAALTTNRVADRAGVNIASLYQYFAGKQAIVAELRRRHGAAARAAVRRILAEDAESDLQSTLRRLVAAGLAEHAAAPALHRAFTEALPSLRTPDVAADDAPTFVAFRRLIERTAVGVPDLDLALWVVATASGALIHRAAVERPEDLSSGVFADELVTLLERYLRRPLSRPRGSDRSAIRRRRDANSTETATSIREESK
jgi:AcrR family transcriptional regulator